MKRVVREAKTSYDFTECLQGPDEQIFFNLTFKTPEFIGCEHNPKVMIEVDEAETLKEFRELNELTKSELLEWLNKNYKK